MLHRILAFVIYPFNSRRFIPDWPELEPPAHPRSRPRPWSRRSPNYRPCLPRLLIFWRPPAEQKWPGSGVTGATTYRNMAAADSSWPANDGRSAVHQMPTCAGCSSIHRGRLGHRGGVTADGCEMVTRGSVRVMGCGSYGLDHRPMTSYQVTPSGVSAASRGGMAPLGTGWYPAGTGCCLARLRRYSF